MVGAGIAFAGNALNGGGGGRGPSAKPDDTLAAAAASPTPTADAKSPLIHISRPDPGSVVYGATETLRGRTEAGATLTVTDENLGSEIDATVERDGSFEAELTLQLGENTFTLSSQDAAGNRGSALLVVTRAMSLGSVMLSVSAADIDVNQLPTALDVTAAVRDENGASLSGAEAIFSLSPPNGATQTYQATTFNGEARWDDMVVSGGRRALGKWLVTVLVVLPSSEKLRDGAFFTVR